MADLEGIFFGPAGWSYADWRGTVYPGPLPARFNHLAFLAGQFGTFPLAVEFRHQGWLEDEVLAFFRSSGLIWTNIDQPLISQSLGLTALVTAGETAYLRLHGRNYQDWFSGQGRDARYDYSYSAAELGRLGTVVARLQEQAKKVFVSGNNHYKGAAVKNLLQLKEILLRRCLAGNH